MNTIYQLRVSLQGTDPQIWRRILVPSIIRLDELHDVIQMAMGWEDCHLFQFTDGKLNYLLPEEDDFTWDNKNNRDCGEVSLDSLISKVGDVLTYIYDFGDEWTHIIMLERIFTPKEIESQIPVCVDGEYEAPPEDCGGIPGYLYMLKVANDPSHDDYDDIREYLGLGSEDTLDALKFIDMEGINKSLRYIFE